MLKITVETESEISAGDIAAISFILALRGKVAAVKWVREQTGARLKESKGLVDHIERLALYGVEDEYPMLAASYREQRGI